MTRNIVSLTALVLLVLGMFCNVMIIFSDKNVVSELWGIDYYKVGAAVGSILAVIFLVYLTSTSTQKSLPYRIIIMSILIIGGIAELIMTNVKLNLEYEEYAKYALLVFNFLFRSYHLIGYVQEPWAEITLDAMNKGINAVTPGPQQSTTAPKPQEKKGDLTQEATNFKNKWREIIKESKEKAGDGVKDQQAWTVINKAIADNELTRTKLQEAADLLVDKDSNKITGLNIPSLGGRRRR